MNKIIKSRWRHFAILLNQRVAGKFIGVVLALWAIATFFRDEIAIPEDDKRWKFVNLALSIPGTAWAIIILATVLAWLFESSFRALSSMADRNRELEKVDRADLQRLLKGMFISPAHFIFDGRWVRQCGIFTGQIEIDQMKDTFIEMTAPVPKNSTACVRLEFMTGRALPGHFHFFFRDAFGNAKRIEDIYQDVKIPANEEGKIALKIVYGGGYELSEYDSLTVRATGWIK